MEPSDYYKGIIHEGFHEKGFDEGTIQMMDLVASGETLFPSVDFFVYGTLRTGGNLARALDGLNRKPASFPGRLYKLGGYPGFYPDKDGGPIVGEKVEVPLARVGEETSSIVAELDRVEGFYGYRAEDWKRSLFHRVWLPTEVYGPNAGCWVYVYSKPEPDLSPDSLIASGDWFRR